MTFPEESYPPHHQSNVIRPPRTPASSEAEMPDTVEPAITPDRRKPGVFAKTMGFGAVVLLAFFAGYGLSSIEEESGPKAGITDIAVNGCEVLDGFGPVNVTASSGNIVKLTERDILALGEVQIKLSTEEVSELSLRPPGELMDPHVPYNQLIITCFQHDGVIIVPPPGTTTPSIGSGEPIAFTPAGS